MQTQQQVTGKTCFDKIKYTESLAFIRTNKSKYQLLLSAIIGDKTTKKEHLVGICQNKSGTLRKKAYFYKETH